MISHQERCNMLYRQMASSPDFPMAKAERLWSILPKGSRDLAATIYLLPFGEEPIENALNLGAAVNALFLFTLVQNDITVNRVFSEEEAVLYGDYLFALSLSLLPQGVSEKNKLQLLSKIASNNERRFCHRKYPVSQEKAMEAARFVHGDFFRSIAQYAMAEQEVNDMIKRGYEDCAEAVGTLWGVLYEEYSCSLSTLEAEVEEAAGGLPMGDKLLALVDNWRIHDIQNQRKDQPRFGAAQVLPGASPAAAENRGTDW